MSELSTVPINPDHPDEALFVVRALQQAESDLEQTFGEEAVHATLDNALAYKAAAIGDSYSAPRSYEELQAAQAEFDKQVGRTRDKDVDIDEADTPTMAPAVNLRDVWDEPEKDADKVPQELGPTAVAIVIEAARKTALHPRVEGDDIQALDFLAHHTNRAEGKVSKFILDKARDHRRVRSAMTSVLLRIA